MFKKLKMKNAQIFDKALIPIIFSLTGLLAGFIFLGKISSSGYENLGIFSFIHSGALIFSHLIRFGSDFDVLKSNKKLIERFSDSDFLIKYVFQLSSVLIFILLCFKNLVPYNLFWGLITACLLSLNIVFSNYIRSKNYINLFSFFLHSPFIISAFLIFFVTNIQEYTAIKIFVFSLSLLVLLQLFFITKFMKVNFFRFVNFLKAKIFYFKLFPIFFSGLVILIAAQLPVIIFGILKNYGDAASFKVLNKICSLLLLTSRAFFASTIPQISSLLKNKVLVQKMYNDRNFIVLMVNLMITGLILLFSSYIKIYFSVEFNLISIILLLIAFHFTSIGGPINELYVITSCEKYMSKIFAISFILTIPFYYYLSLNFGLVGGIISVLFFNLISTISLMILYYKKIGIQLFLPLHFLNND